MERTGTIEEVIKHIEIQLQDDNPFYPGVPKYLVVRLLEAYKAKK